MSAPDSAANAELFQAVIDDHRRRPRNRGPLPTANRVSRGENPLCGDLCTMQFEVVEDRIRAAAFTGAGCALSQASASLATAALAGRTLPEARQLAAVVETLVRTGHPPSASEPAPLPSAPRLGDLAALAAAHAFPARHECALLPWRAAITALDAPFPPSA